MRSLLMGVSLLALDGANGLCTTGAEARRDAARSAIHSSKAGGAASGHSVTGGSSEVSCLLRLGSVGADPRSAQDHRVGGRRVQENRIDADRRHRPHRLCPVRRSTTLRLSERRAEAVKAELIRLGVPATVITTVGKGEEDPLVPTKDGVREAQNRRVEIVIPRPPKPAEPPKPVTAAPAAPPPPATKPPKWFVSLGPWYGYNLRETDRNDDLTSNLVGPDLRLGYYLTPNWVVKADGVLFNTVGTSAKDGWGARGLAGISHVWDLGAWEPFIGPHVGYIAGRGTQDGVFVGPELGVNYELHRNMFLYARAGYDNNFRNDFGQGIANGGIGAGYRW